MNSSDPTSTRRRLLATLAGAGSISLAGCPSDSSGASPSPTERRTPTATPTETTVEQDPTAEIHVYSDFGTREWELKWVEELVPAFESRSQAPVRFEMAGAVPNRVDRLLENGTPPEIVHGTLVNHGEHILEGETVPVGDLVSDLETTNGRLRDSSLIRTGGSTYVVPHGWSLGGVLQYREDIYDELDLSVPRTWIELIENARAIDESEVVDARGFGLPAANRFEDLTANNFSNWLYTAGGDYWRWTDEDAGEVAIDFREEHVRAALETMQELAQYSPDPSTYRYDTMFQDWIDGTIGHCMSPNGALAGAAYQEGATDVALGTNHALIPLRERNLNPATRGWSAIDGSAIFRRADNRSGARELLRFLYDGPERQAEMNLVHPMTWLPPYEGIMETETYRSADIFQAEDGHFLELNRRLVEDFAPHHSGERPQNSATVYTRSFAIGGDLVEAVVGQHAEVDGEIETARDRLASHLEEGREFAAA